jgi:hypothetical protein
MIYTQYIYNVYEVYASITILYVYLNLNLRDLDYSRTDHALAVGGNESDWAVGQNESGLHPGANELSTPTLDTLHDSFD